MSLIPKAKFPNVPQLPGVPQLQRALAALPSGVPALVGLPLTVRNLLAALNNASTYAWGIYDDQNQLAIEPDSIVDLDIRKEYSMSNFPVQKGSFASYNKVSLPGEVVVRMTKGGGIVDREAFFAKLVAMAPSTRLFRVLTPERNITNVNLARYEISRRGAQGAYFIEVDVYFNEIRQVTPQYTDSSRLTQNAQVPTALGPVTQGYVQPQSLPSIIAGKVSSALTGLSRL